MLYLVLRTSFTTYSNKASFKGLIGRFNRSLGLRIVGSASDNRHMLDIHKVLQCTLKFSTIIAISIKKSADLHVRYKSQESIQSYRATIRPYPTIYNSRYSFTLFIFYSLKPYITREVIFYLYFLIILVKISSSKVCEKASK